jgi:hypothetical protein
LTLKQGKNVLHALDFRHASDHFPRVSDCNACHRAARRLIMVWLSVALLQQTIIEKAGPMAYLAFNDGQSSILKRD